jgi:hypothetical protein
MLRTVRTTMQPDQDIEVEDGDYESLRMQGLLIEEPSTSDTSDNESDAKPEQPDPKPTTSTEPEAAATDQTGTQRAGKTT